MPIDSMGRIGGAVARIAGATYARPLAREVPGQDLPGAGKTPPSEVVAATVPSADMQQAVSRLANYVQSLRRDLQFSVDERSGKTVVKIVDPETGETIRQIPTAEMLSISQALSQSMGQSGGILLNDRA